MRKLAGTLRRYSCTVVCLGGSERLGRSLCSLLRLLLRSDRSLSELLGLGLRLGLGLNLLNRLTKQKDRLIEISADGELSPDEYRDFTAIRKDLEKMSMVIDSMQLWIENRIVDGSIREELLSDDRSE